MSLRGVSTICFLILFSAAALADVPAVSSDTHPNGEWSGERAIKMSISMPGATGFSYETDQAEGTIPDTTVDSEVGDISLGSKLDGIYWFHVRAKTDSGWSDTAHYEIKVDNSGPSRPGNPVATPLEDGTIMVEWGAASDELSGVAYYDVYRSVLRFVKEGEISREFTIRDAVAKLVGPDIEGTSFHDTNNIGEGYRYHYKLVAFDNAGNQGVISSAASVRAPSFCDLDFTVETSVSEDKNLSIGVAANGFFRKGHIIITGPGNEQAVLLESTERVDLAEVAYSLASKPNGDYNIFFTSIDDDFDECVAQETFIYDTTLPQIKVLSPSPATELTESVRFEIQASDGGVNPSGISSVSILLEKNGSETLVGEAEKEGPNYVFDWNTITSENGRFRVIARVSDRGGNKAEDSAIYTFKNTFFARINADSAIKSAEAERAKAVEFIGNLKEKNLYFDDLNAAIKSADANLSYAKQLMGQGLYFELAEGQAQAAETIFSSVSEKVLVEDYGSKVYTYNKDQLDIFLQASGIDSGMAGEAKELISRLNPSRKLFLLKVSAYGKTYYKANVEVSVFNPDRNSVAVKVLEVIPKQFTNDSNNIFSYSGFEALQNDPVILFEPFTLAPKTSKKLTYSMDIELSKAQADALLSGNVLNFYVSPPIILSESRSVAGLSSLLSFNSLLSFLPPIDWNTTNLFIVGAAILVMLFIMFVALVVAAFGVYFFFIRKKRG